MCDNLTGQERILEVFEKKKDLAEQDSNNNSPSSAPPLTSSGFQSENFTFADRDTDVEMDNGDGVDDVQSDEVFIQYLQKIRDYGFDDNNDTSLPIDGMEDEDIEGEGEEFPFPKPYLPENVHMHTPAEGTDNSAQRIAGTYIRVVHTNGIHNIAMISCECQGPDVLPCDLIAARFLPASFDRIRTLFSAQVLDQFRISNLELKATAYQFYHMLKRLTNPIAPAEVVDLYREFRRMSRIWRWMKRLKWAGYGSTQSKVKDVKPGQLTVFCPACPQPGINIPDNWKDDPTR